MTAESGSRRTPSNHAVNAEGTAASGASSGWTGAPTIAAAAGRRWSLITGTLRPPDAETGIALGSPSAIVRRMAGLVRRWGSTLLR